MVFILPAVVSASSHLLVSLANPIHIEVYENHKFKIKSSRSSMQKKFFLKEESCLILNKHESAVHFDAYIHNALPREKKCDINAAVARHAAFAGIKENPFTI